MTAGPSDLRATTPNPGNDAGFRCPLGSPNQITYTNVFALADGVENGTAAASER